MTFQKEFKNKLFLVNPENFEEYSMSLFRYQYSNNPIYRRYVQLLGLHPSRITSLERIPFLPVELFKSHKVLIEGVPVETVFESSRTTAIQPSKHYISNLSHYREVFVRNFEHFFGHIDQYCFLALLPSYLERKSSSLVYMVNGLMEKSNSPQNGFFLYDYEELMHEIVKLKSNKKRIVLIGVSFALLELAHKYKLNLADHIIIETGGMKGRGRELPRVELHQNLIDSFNVQRIHSEYGMTELLSQAYSMQDGIFKTPPWMKVVIRDQRDPFSLLGAGENGCINIIDLANIHSCAFLATQDVGKLIDESSFNITGRMDGSEIRGCNLLMA
ncbi:acyl transferase [Bacteroidota bacterium]